MSDGLAIHNLYEILEVPVEASSEEIRRAYLRLSLQVHCIRTPGPTKGVNSATQTSHTTRVPKKDSMPCDWPMRP